MGINLLYTLIRSFISAECTQGAVKVLHIVFTQNYRRETNTVKPVHSGQERSRRKVAVRSR